MTMEIDARALAGTGLATQALLKVMLLMASIGAIGWSLSALVTRPDTPDVSGAFPNSWVALTRMQAVFPEINGADDVWRSGGQVDGRKIYTILFARGDQAKAVRAYLDATGRMKELQTRIGRDRPIDPIDQVYYISPIVAAVSGAATGEERAAAVDALAALAQRGQPGAIDIGPAHISITTTGGLVIRATPRDGAVKA